MFVRGNYHKPRKRGYVILITHGSQENTARHGTISRNASHEFVTLSYAAVTFCCLEEHNTLC